MTKLFEKDQIQVICSDKVREYTSRVNEMAQVVQEWKKKLAECETDQDWFIEMILKQKQQQYKHVLKQKRGWAIRLAIASGKEVQAQYIDAELIKQIPCDIFLGEHKGISGGRKRYLCPLHEEKTASFVWYMKDNRWHCFGCGRYGSVVDLVMQLHNLDFYQALKHLKDYV